ncbi:MAG: hypothetical protein F4246_07230 [Rhodothermaceae bacterium]|nr:hypothetical protein [Rhodothermaceae bacterium]MYD20415.1 hypothetical protein [Rhodothermaceae bacterium]MYD56788.1 hypothetical protein [Rhodothermaceae bacterium]MYI44252.1 hypothetical protein [Rhodothermaceae bacterium]MYJ55087.1 hypothetical protein [Rhodothermaceae bacterium]
MSPTAFIISLFCTIGLSVAAYYLIKVQNRTLYLIGFVGFFLMLLSLVLNILGIWEFPSSLLASLMVLTGLGAFGWGMGGAMREWIWQRFANPQ